MATRRMMAPELMLNSDRFLAMPDGAKLLYMFLLQCADDDGFTEEVLSTMRKCCITEDNLKVLITKKYVISFESGVIVIRHWKVHNYIKPDRYHPTKHREEAAQIAVIDNVYLLIGSEISRDSVSDADVLLFRILEFLKEDKMEPVCLQNGTREIESGEVRKNSSFFSSSESENKNHIPTLEQVRAYCKEKKYHVNPERFMNVNNKRNWRYKNGDPVTDWKRCLDVWEQREWNKPKYVPDAGTLPELPEDNSLNPLERAMKRSGML